MKIQYPSQANCPHQGRSQSTTFNRSDVMVLFQWLSLFLLIGAVVLFPERPAWGSGLDLPWHQSGISANGGGCFISASISEFGGISLLFGFCLLTMMYGIRLLIRSTNTRHEMK